ncbi:MAG: uracil-DNA glycosylase [Desulfurella sp.]|jgi:DNA polymerase|uniref:Type-4 uracil-DNA glycosylase n=1 Tax=Desulfurella multipotens TaxID=79269 RepID=A0A1G6PLR4_9BACT|nr:MULTISPECIES: uracil-DNA glycosylase [Desulfurella]AHF96488.1 DNA polymerase [Desulfurella acetivorans A63]HEX13470.1 uracil-DNA glycosylase [Desulfurella acetivorans]PMP63423.1 MAG: uracil-DNA glycosylase [Desulfurella multipotens]PMP87298.1 MAG: uracil-DNA glycosylase [Desulfurella sp.]SDC80978.1 DNA polymerase [Desulfurella multipotens]
MKENQLSNILNFYKDLGVEYLNIKFKKTTETQKNVEAELEKLKKAVENCKACDLHKTKKNYVFGDGNPNAQLMFIGEAPGASEDEQGLPFVGRAGQLLNELLKEVGIARKDVYIANCLKCRPPNNRDPQENELKACRPFLDKQMELIKPKVIITLGRFALMQILGNDKKITQTRGLIFDKKTYIAIPTYHPAYLLRNPKAIEIFLNDLKTAKQYLGG